MSGEPFSQSNCCLLLYLLKCLGVFFRCLSIRPHMKVFFSEDHPSQTLVSSGNAGNIFKKEENPECTRVLLNLDNVSGSYVCLYAFPKYRPSDNCQLVRAEMLPSSFRERS